MSTAYQKPPKWVTVIIVLLILPVFQVPWLLSHSAEWADRPLIYLYPGYVLLSGFLAFASYAQRPTVAWILMGLMVLSHLSMAYLALNPIY